MVYIDSWDEFADRSVQLFRADPNSFRYVTKYRHCDGKLVLKATDNRVFRYVMKYEHCDGKLVLKVIDNRECLKFKTDQAQDAKKMEKLNNIFFTLMARGPDVDLSEAAVKEQVEQQVSKKGRGRRQ